MALKEALRVDEPPHYEAVREALVNALIHANYNLPTAILVLDTPHSIMFRNPGTLLVPKHRAIQGGAANSNCRNPTLQKMFQLIGFAEQAGSGFPKIFRGWRSLDWIEPELSEDLELEQTCLSLKMISLYPKEILKQIHEQFSTSFEKLSALERRIVVSTFSEGKTNKAHILKICKEHPADVAKALRQVVEKGFLLSDGTGRGSFYRPNTATNKVPANDTAQFSDRRLSCLRLLSEKEYTSSELQLLLNFKSKSSFRREVLTFLLEQALIERTNPETPNSPKQRYRLTNKGNLLLTSSPP